MTRLGGLTRLVHPFPSVLDGLVTTGIAFAAGGDPAAAIRLGLSMTAIQFSIGTLNDLVDAVRDATGQPAKPLPARLVTRRQAWLVFTVTAVGGPALALPSGLPTTLVALAGAGVGYLYDLRLKGTAWSWTGFALGLPLLPVFAWLGATGELPAPLALFAALAGVAGAGLAVSNAVADLDRDRAAGADSIAVRLGRARAGAPVVCLQATVIAGALGSLVGLAGDGGGWWPVAAGLGALVLGVGVGLTLRPLRRAELGWEVQGVGLGLLAVGWTGAVVLSGAV